jgi:hypothetical protein
MMQVGNAIQWVLQVMVPSACSFIVLVLTVSLHISAYMAIFRRVGYFNFHMLEGFCFPGTKISEAESFKHM